VEGVKVRLGTEMEATVLLRESGYLYKVQYGKVFSPSLQQPKAKAHQSPERKGFSSERRKGKLPVMIA
jgi:hypothetical protein